MIGRLERQPMPQTGLDLRQRLAAFTGRLEKDCNQMIQLIMTHQLLLRFLAPHINAAAFAKLDPALPGQFAISRAHCVRMDFKATSKFARTGEFLTSLQIAARYSQTYLDHQLFAERDFAAFGKPEAHGQRRISQRG